MFGQTNIARMVSLLVVLGATVITPQTAKSQTTANVPKVQDRLALGENEVKQLLLLMDTNQNGKISKREYMHFMEAEFERLDKNKNGELDPKELTRSRLRASQNFTAVGK
jgi:Ca2+-binding EF-hand superfamily protein